MNKHWKKSFTNEAKCLKSICSRWCAEEHVQRYLIQQRFWIWVIFAEVKRCPKYCGKVQQTLNNVSKYMWVESLSKLVIDHKKTTWIQKEKCRVSWMSTSTHLAGMCVWKNERNTWSDSSQSIEDFPHAKTQVKKLSFEMNSHSYECTSSEPEITWMKEKKKSHDELHP